MAIVTENFNADGNTKSFTVGTNILSKSHVRVDFYYDAADHQVASTEWNVLTSTIVFNTAPTSGYVVKITVSTDGTGLDAGPSDISSVAQYIDNVNTVATNISNVNTVATNDANVTTVAGVSGNVTTVAGSIANVNTVAGNLTNINIVGPISADVTTVAGISADVTAVSTNNANVTTTATDIANVNTTATNIADVNTVAANIADINTVATGANLADIIRVADDLNSLDVNGIADITVVATDLTGTNNITTVSSNIADVNTVATNIADVNWIADTYFIAATAPVSPTDGDLWFDTANNIMKVYATATGWANAGSSVNGTTARYDYVVGTPSGDYTGASNTTFPAIYDSGYVDVWVDGMKLVPTTDFTATDGTNVVIASALAAGQDVQIIGYGTFELANHYTKAETDTIKANLSNSGKSAMLRGNVAISGSSSITGMATQLYTGNGTSQSVVTGADMTTQWGDTAKEQYGGLVWLKSRSGINHNNLYDTVRGSYQFILTNSTNAESDGTASDVGVSSFNNNGFSLGAHSYGNASSVTYASWTFQTTHRDSATFGSSELVTGDDSTFTSGVGSWLPDDGGHTLTNTGSVLNINGTATYDGAYLTLTTVANTYYTIQFTGNKGTSNEVRFYASTSLGSGDLALYTSTHDGVHTVTFKATGTSTIIELRSGVTIGNPTFDNISVKENHTPTNHGKYWESHYNPVTGFTIVKYEGSGITGHEIPHKLDRKLGFWTIKNIHRSDTGWNGSYLNNNDEYLTFNDTLSSTASAGIFNNTADYLAVSARVHINDAGDSHILYGWSNSYYDNAGSLKGNYEVGTYIGTGAAGNKITTKKKPAWIMVKGVSSAESWLIQDNQRGSADYYIAANVSDAEVSLYNVMDIQEDGFTPDPDGNGYSAYNTSGVEYLYFVIYDNDSGSGDSKFDMPVTNANLAISNMTLSYVNGADANGVVNTVENTTSLNITSWDV